MMIPFLTSIPYMVLKTFGLAGLVFFCIFPADSDWHQFNWLSVSGTVKTLLRRDQGFRLGGWGTTRVLFVTRKFWTESVCARALSWLMKRAVFWPKFWSFPVHCISQMMINFHIEFWMHCLISRSKPVVHQTLTFRNKEHCFYILSAL
jgi:hypothetical protein